MDEKAKLYVFAKKEVALIFVFMILIAVTSFFLGIKIGKDYSYRNEGFTPHDRERVDLLSGQEEKVNEIVKEKTVDSDQISQENINKQLEKKIMEELEKDGSNNLSSEKGEEVETSQNSSDDIIAAATPKNSSTRDKFSGKHTIQLGSYRKLSDAEDFARGFKVRGYNPIINEVQLANRGTWYRVSLGVFDSLADAKDYVLKEKELFMGQDYVFVQFD